MCYIFLIIKGIIYKFKSSARTYFIRIIITHTILIKMKGELNMCGIVGYIGKKKAEPILINGLLRLEYRGYDSAGIATMEEERNRDY